MKRLESSSKPGKHRFHLRPIETHIEFKLSGHVILAMFDEITHIDDELRLVQSIQLFSGRCLNVVIFGTSEASERCQEFIRVSATFQACLRFRVSI